MRLLRSSTLALGLIGAAAGCHTAGVCDGGCDGGWGGDGHVGAVAELPAASPAYSSPAYGGPVVKGNAPTPAGDKTSGGVEARPGF
jgi:hypothetical protein